MLMDAQKHSWNYQNHIFNEIFEYNSKLNLGEHSQAACKWYLACLCSFSLNRNAKMLQNCKSKRTSYSYKDNRQYNQQNRPA